MNKTNNREYIDNLKRRVGKQPFLARAKFANGKAPCPFHGGDAGFDLFERDGMWFGSCHSACNKKWDVIQFVMDFDHVDFKNAVARIGGRVGNALPPAEKPKKRAMTEAEWQAWGHPVTAEEIATFATSRKDKTAGFETFRRLGCRVKEGVLAFPYRLTLENGEVKYFTIKTRGLTEKEIFHLEGHCVDSKSLFNLDTVTCFEPVYVVEGEPDVAIMEEAGFRAVSVMNAGHDKFTKAQLDILCEAEYIYLMGDQNQRGVDDPGSNCMDALARQLPPDKVSRISFREAKDPCELARIYGDGFEARIQELSEDAMIPWVNKNVQDVSRLIKLPAPRWIVDRMIPYKGVTILCSPQGGQKTALSLFIARAIRNPIRTDFKFLGRPITPFARHEIGEGAFAGSPDLPVLYIDRENPPEEIGGRLRRMGLLGDRRFKYWSDGDEFDTPDVNDPRLEEWAKKTGGVIVFDSLQDWYGDAKEIDNSAMVKLMHGFRRLARLGGGVIILHHVAKSGNHDIETLEDMTKFYRGGTGIVSIPEMAIGLVGNKETKEITLGEIRFRMCQEWRLKVKLDWEAGPDGKWIDLSLVEDLNAKEIYAQRNGYREEKKAAKDADLDSLAERLEAEVLKNAKLSARELEESTGIGRNRVPKLLARRGLKRTGGEWHKDVESEQIPFGVQ